MIVFVIFFCYLVIIVFFVEFGFFLKFKVIEGFIWRFVCIMYLFLVVENFLKECLLSFKIVFILVSFLWILLIVLLLFIIDLGRFFNKFRNFVFEYVLLEVNEGVIIDGGSLFSKFKSFVL